MMDNAFPAYQGIYLIWVKRLVSIETLALHWPGGGRGGGGEGGEGGKTPKSGFIKRALPS